LVKVSVEWLEPPGTDEGIIAARLPISLESAGKAADVKYEGIWAALQQLFLRLFQVALTTQQN
jgi:hypothetical protein